MEKKEIAPAVELVNAVKENILKPMYLGINENTNKAKTELEVELLKKLEDISSKIKEVKTQQDAFVEAIKNVKWDL
jgi:hypothetical protein